MIVKHIQLALAVSALIWSVPAWAGDREPEINIDYTLNCMKYSENAFDCVGEAAGACTNLSPSIKGMTGCLALERDYWQVRMTEAFDGLLSRYSSFDSLNSDNTNYNKTNYKSLVDGVNLMHLGWIEFRDASCRQHRFAHGESEQLKFQETQCLMEMNGEQTLYLKWVLEGRP